MDEPKKFVALNDASTDPSVFPAADSVLFFIKYGDFARAYEILRKEVLVSNPWVADFLSFGNNEEIKSAPSEEAGEGFKPGSIDEAYAYCEGLPLDDILSDDTFSAFLIYASQRYLKDLSLSQEEVSVISGLSQLAESRKPHEVPMSEIKAFFVKKGQSPAGPSERPLARTMRSLVEENYLIKSKEKKFSLSHEGKNIVYALRFFNAKPAKAAKA